MTTINKISEELKHEIVSLKTYKGVVTEIHTHDLDISELGHIAYQTANFGNRVEFTNREMMLDNDERVATISFKVGNIKLIFYSKRYLKGL